MIGVYTWKDDALRGSKEGKGGSGNAASRLRSRQAQNQHMIYLSTTCQFSFQIYRSCEAGSEIRKEPFAFGVRNPESRLIRNIGQSHRQHAFQPYKYSGSYFEILRQPPPLSLPTSFLKSFVNDPLNKQ